MKINKKKYFLHDEETSAALIEIFTLHSDDIWTKRVEKQALS